MRKTKHWLMTIAALLCSLAASAHDFEVGGIYYNITSSSDLTVAVTYKGDYYDSYSNEYSGAVTIPSTVTYNSKTYSVTSIGEKAFVSCRNLTSITLPEDVTSIGHYAFASCHSLTSITLPEGVTSIGFQAFAYCHSLTSIIIPENLTSIDNYAFWNCTNLPSITIPENSQLASIGGYAFGGCSSLTFITLPESVTSIGEYAFIDCSSLTSFVSFSSVAPKINETSTFERINADATLTIPYGSTSSYEDAGWLSHFASVVEMNPRGNDGNITWELTSDGELIIEGTGAMNNYASLTYAPWYEHRSSITKVTIKEGVTSIGSYAFIDCSSLTSITIPESVTVIESGAFRNCSSLTAITIPEGVTSIGNYAFYYCSSLTSINIPTSVTVIRSGAFGYCTNLPSITIPENSQLASIGDYAFEDCRSLASITIPESVTRIGGGAFYGCSSLTSINIPEGVTSIGWSAFYGCDNLAAVHIKDIAAWCNIDYADSSSNPLYYAKNLYLNGELVTDLTIPDGVTSIKGNAFRNCSSLTSITLPEGVMGIGDYAFSGCSSLTSISIPEGVTRIEESTFSGCSSLTAITLPESVTSIGESAFEDCSSLTTISIPESVTSIGESAFEDCSSLTAITIPEGVTYIEYYAFRNCSSLTAITIPEGVTGIGEYAFQGCSSLTAITIPEGVAYIEYYAFRNCSSLTDVYCYAEEVPTTHTYAFNSSNIGNATLHVLASVLDAYKTTTPWSSFGKFEILPPRPITITMNQYGSGTYCSPYALDFSEVEGLKAYAATGYKTSTGVITLTRVMTANAGVGLFLKGDPGEYTVPVLESTDENSLNLLVGTLESTEVNSTSNDGLYANFRYTIKDGDETPLFYRVDDGYTLGAGKAYLQIPVAWMPAEAKSISLRFDDEGTTDIENDAELENLNSELEIYDLMGRRVSTPQRGSLYLINGKKIIY